MKIMKLAFVIALATGMALQVGAMPRPNQVADLIEGQVAARQQPEHHLTGGDLRMLCQTNHYFII